MIELAGPEWEERLRQFVMYHAGVGAPTGPTQVLGYLQDREILGAWMFERYTGVTGSLVAHWAATGVGWLRPDMLRLAAIYIYDQLGVNVVWGEVRRSDSYTRKVNEKLGFRKVAILEGYFPDDDLVIYSLTRQECRWLPDAFKEGPDGKEVEAAEGA